MELNRYFAEPDLLLRLARETKAVSDGAMELRRLATQKHARTQRLVHAWGRLADHLAGVLACMAALGIEADSEEMRTRQMKLIIRWIAQLEAKGAEEQRC